MSLTTQVSAQRLLSAGHRQRRSGFQVGVVICDDSPYATIFGNNLQQSCMERAFLVFCDAWRSLRARDTGEGFDDGDVGADESQRSDILRQRAVLEYPVEDYLMLFEKGVVTFEVLAADVGEGSRAREISRVSDGVAFIPARGLTVDDSANRCPV